MIITNRISNFCTADLVRGYDRFEIHYKKWKFNTAEMFCDHGD